MADESISAVTPPPSPGSNCSGKSPWKTNESREEGDGNAGEGSDLGVIKGRGQVWNDSELEEFLAEVTKLEDSEDEGDEGQPMPEGSGDKSKSENVFSCLHVQSREPTWRNPGVESSFQSDQASSCDGTLKKKEGLQGCRLTSPWWCSTTLPRTTGTSTAIRRQSLPSRSSKTLSPPSKLVSSVKVIGSQEIYRDPRLRRVNSQELPKDQDMKNEEWSFAEKLKYFKKKIEEQSLKTCSVKSTRVGRGSLATNN